MAAESFVISGNYNIDSGFIYLDDIYEKPDYQAQVMEILNGILIKINL